MTFQTFLQTKYPLYVNPEMKVNLTVSQLCELVEEWENETDDDKISVEFLMSKHNLPKKQAESLLNFCHEHTIRYKQCYGEGQIMFPKWINNLTNKHNEKTN